MQSGGMDGSALRATCHRGPPGAIVRHGAGVRGMPCHVPHHLAHAAFWWLALFIVASFFTTVGAAPGRRDAAPLHSVRGEAPRASLSQRPGPVCNALAGAGLPPLALTTLGAPSCSAALPPCSGPSDFWSWCMYQRVDDTACSEWHHMGPRG